MSKPQAMFAKSLLRVFPPKANVVSRKIDTWTRIFIFLYVINFIDGLL